VAATRQSWEEVKDSDDNSEDN